MPDNLGRPSSGMRFVVILSAAAILVSLLLCGVTQGWIKLP